MVSGTSVWYPTAPAAVNPQATLFCFPHGGGDISSFRDWQKGLGNRIALVPAALPGRERRIREPLVPSIATLADSLRQPTLQRATGTFALFGHSMGALVAFELAHRLTESGHPPALLVVSGAPGPQTPTPMAGPRADEMSDAEFLDSVMALGGAPSVLLEVPELRDLVLPVLRADYLACENYEAEERPPLDVPILVLCGDDDPYAGPSDVKGWQQTTTRETEIRCFDGGHFFVYERQAEVFVAIQAALDGALGA
ncbi:alpha/beta fold hydrolase [Kribbella sp. NPDC051718]|uniref:thioesterase II family protein n=1 Tax=Kribbella sp. NPDC051718 TaxID=3155168 RepID=UPI003439CB73